MRIVLLRILRKRLFLSLPLSSLFVVKINLMLLIEVIEVVIYYDIDIFNSNDSVSAGITLKDPMTTGLHAPLIHPSEYYSK